VSGALAWGNDCTLASALWWCMAAGPFQLLNAVSSSRLSLPAQVCIAHRTGQRISGPLFFGFSDPLTQRAIAVNLYTPAELAAARRVSRHLRWCGLQTW